MREVSFTEIEGLRRASGHEIQVYFWTTASLQIVSPMLEIFYFELDNICLDFQV